MPCRCEQAASAHRPKIELRVFSITKRARNRGCGRVPACLPDFPDLMGEWRKKRGRTNLKQVSYLNGFPPPDSPGAGRARTRRRLTVLAVDSHAPTHAAAPTKFCCARRNRTGNLWLLELYDGLNRCFEFEEYISEPHSRWEGLARSAQR